MYTAEGGGGGGGAEDIFKEGKFFNIPPTHHTEFFDIPPPPGLGKDNKIWAI